MKRPAQSVPCRRPRVRRDPKTQHDRADADFVTVRQARRRSRPVSAQIVFRSCCRDLRRSRRWPKRRCARDGAKRSANRSGCRRRPSRPRTFSPACSGSRRPSLISQQKVGDSPAGFDARSLRRRSRKTRSQSDARSGRIAAVVRYRRAPRESRRSELARFASDTNVAGHSCSCSSFFDKARGRWSTSVLSSSNALGDRWISSPPRRSCRGLGVEGQIAELESQDRPPAKTRRIPMTRQGLVRTDFNISATLAVLGSSTQRQACDETLCCSRWVRCAGVLRFRTECTMPLEGNHRWSKR